MAAGPAPVLQPPVETPRPREVLSQGMDPDLVLVAVHRLVQRHPVAQRPRLHDPRRVRDHRPGGPQAGSLTEPPALSVKRGNPTPYQQQPQPRTAGPQVAGRPHTLRESRLAAVDGGECADISTNAGKFDVTEDRGGSTQLMPQSAVGRSPNDVKPLAGPSGGDGAEGADVKGGGERPGPRTTDHRRMWRYRSPGPPMRPNSRWEGLVPATRARHRLLR